MKETTFGEFKNIISNEIECFLKYWEKQNEINPSNFPMGMELGDWWEQFEIYSSKRIKL